MNLIFSSQNINETILIRLQNNLNSDKTVNTFVSKTYRMSMSTMFTLKEVPRVERQMRDYLTFDVSSSVVKELRIMI